MPGDLLHAATLRFSYARETRNSLDVGKYLEEKNMFGQMPLVLLSGDFLQLPPVPESASMLHKPPLADNEKRQGRNLLMTIPYVFEFTSTKEVR